MFLVYIMSLSRKPSTPGRAGFICLKLYTECTVYDYTPDTKINIAFCYRCQHVYSTMTY